jgi:hypothetical protein
MAGLFKKIRSALFSEQQEEEALGSDISDVKRKEEETWVALGLADVLKKHPKARLQVISLAEFRAAIGDAWETRAGTIRMLSESTLRSHLRLGESCLSQGDDVFVLLMPGVDEKLCAKRGYDAAVQLGQKLVGDKFTTGSVDGVVPQVRLASLAVSDMVNADGRVDVGAVLAVAEKAISVKKIEGAMKQAAARMVEGKTKSGMDQWATITPDRAQTGSAPRMVGDPAISSHKKAEPNWAPISKDK